MLSHTQTGNSWLMQGKTLLPPGSVAFSRMGFFPVSIWNKGVRPPIMSFIIATVCKTIKLCSMLQAFNTFNTERGASENCFGWGSRVRDVLVERWTNISITLVKYIYLNMTQGFSLSRWILIPVLVVIWNVIITNCLHILEWLLVMSIQCIF